MSDMQTYRKFIGSGLMQKNNQTNKNPKVLLAKESDTKYSKKNKVQHNE